MCLNTDDEVDPIMIRQRLEKLPKIMLNIQTGPDYVVYLLYYYACSA